MMSRPGDVQFQAARVFSLAHLISLVASGVEDYYIPLAGNRLPMTIGRGAHGLITVYDKSKDQWEQIDPEGLHTTHLADCIEQGRLYYHAA